MSTSPGNREAVLITGGTGQLATALADQLRQATNYHVLDWPRRMFDITDRNVFDRLDDRQEPTVIVNCAAYTHVAMANEAREAAWRVNSEAVARLAAWCSMHAATFIQVSTDFVFGRDRNRDLPYSEVDCIGPVNWYGHSKLGGEYEILRVHRSRPFRHYILRTAGLFSMPRPGRKGNFPEIVGACAKDTEPMRVINDVYTNLTRAEDLAKAIVYFIEQPDRPTFMESGTYHVVNPGEMTWYDAARRIMAHLGGPVPEATTREQWWSTRKLDPDLVPNYTCLDVRKHQAVGGHALPPAADALAEWCKTYKEMYG